MAKILLVEDDNNLREIYEARLQAEGYTIVSAKDGEEALVLAKAEHPDLIISDVMMPRVSGFEMLDILRNTDGLKDTKIIMLTALGQAEDKTRADALGADSYLVKSQVTLEDIVKTAQDLLEKPAASAAGVASVPTAPAATVVSMPATQPVVPAPPVAVAPTPTPQPTPVPMPVTTAPIPVSTPTTSVPPTQPAPAPQPVAPPVTPAPATPAPVEPPQPPAPAVNTAVPAPKPAPAVPPQPAVAPSTPQPIASAPTQQPATPPAQQTNPVAPTLTQSASNEEAAMQAQINNFVNQPTTLSQTPTPVPAPAPTAQPAPVPTPQTPPVVPPVSDTKATDQLVADAVKNLSVGTTPQPAPPVAVEPASQPIASAPITVQPTPVAPPPPNDKDDDSVTVAHKKIISPIVDANVSNKPDLNELLAREGINNMDDLPHQPATPLNPTPQSYTTPHPPGHVISPNSGGVDPNSIAL